MKTIGIFLLVVLSAVAIYYFASPHMAYQSIRENLEQENNGELLKSLDLPQIRENLKKSANGWVRDEFELGDFGSFVSNIVTNGVIDAVGSEQFIKDLVWENIEDFKRASELSITS